VERVELLWSTYKELDVSPLSANESKEKGARLEALDQVAGLPAVISFS
jgi:phosphomevalonate kinase